MKPTDPLYDEQWHFDLIGDIETIWDDYDGTGVTVGVYDDGIDYNHPDLDANYNGSLVAVDDLGNPLDPFPAQFVPDGDGHGTSVSGLIAAEANNGTGGVGVAFGATLGAVNIFDPALYGAVNGDVPAFMDVASQAVMFDISSNSWGATPLYTQGLDDGGFADALDEVYKEVVRDGRGGLGTIITQAAGNDDMDANGDGVNASRFTITVAATDEFGDAAWYSNFGSSILVAAPAAAVTTDLSGSAGYDETDYTDEFGGTSAATPVTSGVIALMLDAAPGLGWRDVQNILAASATLTGSAFNSDVAGLEEDGTWQANNAETWNGGGFHIHSNYGFGMINVFNAVRMAEVWSLFGGPKFSGNEEMVSGKNNFSDVTVTGDKGIERNIVVNEDLTVEHVALTLEVDSDQMMDLKVVLTSPDGTKVTVVLDDSKLINPFDEIDGKWTYGIDVLRGESAEGTWTVKVIDMRNPGKSTVLESAELKIYGSTPTVNDVHHITDEFVKMKGFQGGRSVVTDSDGGTDWLNFAAVAGDVSLDLAAGTFGVDGKSWGTLSGTFERAVSGDGNDSLRGNASNNHLYGMRGQDVLYGSKGNDKLNGGELGDRLYGEANKDSLYGEDGADRLQGGDGEDYLNGGAGNDALQGGTGSDTYRYGRGDTITEQANGGTDKVNSDVSYGLAAQVERLNLIGTEDINGTGNGLANLINGNSGDNKLDGRDGNDQLNGKGGEDVLIGGGGSDTFDGGTGADVMTGGAGSDVFRFTNVPDGVTIDRITDFQSGIDLIFLSETAFRALPDGALAAKAFASNASGTAQDGSDRIIYEEDTGILWYDSNGDASGGRVKFAQLDAGLTLTAADFFVF